MRRHMKISCTREAGQLVIRIPDADILERAALLGNNFQDEQACLDDFTKGLAEFAGSQADNNSAIEQIIDAALEEYAYATGEPEN